VPCTGIRAHLLIPAHLRWEEERNPRVCVEGHLAFLERGGRERELAATEKKGRGKFYNLNLKKSFNLHRRREAQLLTEHGKKRKGIFLLLKKSRLSASLLLPSSQQKKGRKRTIGDGISSS